MRIAIVGLHYSPEPSGNAPFTTALSEGLSALGHDVTVTTGVPHYPDWRVAPGYGQWRTRSRIREVDVVRLRHYVPRRPTLSRRAIMELSFGVRVLCQGRPFRGADIVICVSPALFATAVIAQRMRLRRSAAPAWGVWVQDLYSSGMKELHHQRRLARAVARIESHVLRHADGVAVAHPRFRDQLVERLGVEAAAIEVIPNWTRNTEANPAFDRDETRTRFGWQGRVVAVHAGNMGVKQGLENVVAAARLADARGVDVLFVLAGGGNQEQHLRTLAEGVKRIRFIGSLPDDEYAALLRAADVLVVNEAPGVTEMSVPSKLTSYFAAGRPVVAATRRGGLTETEIVRSGAGCWVPSGVPVALLEAVERLGRDEVEAERLGGEGIHYSNTSLSAQAALTHFDSWVAQLAERRRLEHGPDASS